MTLKEATANSLLMFVAATCVVLIVKAISPTLQAPQATANGQAEPAPDRAGKDGIQVYYLHGNFRCPTCRTIEAYAQEAVESGFSEELRDGRIKWQVINYEEPGNERYAIDYEVVAPTVILVRFEDGRQVDWKGLHEVWEHVGDKDAFLSFVQSNLRQFMGPASDKGSTLSQTTSLPLPEVDVPLPDASDTEVPVPPMPPVQSEAPRSATAELPTADATDSEPASPPSPLRSTTDAPEFSLPTPNH